MKCLPSGFWKNVNRNTRPGECWIWYEGRRHHGYGRIGSLQEGAHRVAWELTNGPIPDGLDVLHKCDNPPCVNPDHLFLGDQEANMNDMAAKGRARNKYTARRA
jgi:hypothetical protein